MKHTYHIEIRIVLWAILGVACLVPAPQAWAYCWTVSGSTFCDNRESSSGGGGGDYSSGRSEKPDRKHFRWGKEYEKEGNFNAAAAEYRKAIANNPTWYGYRLGLGFALYSLKDYGGALDAYRSADSLNPGDSTIHHGIGLMLWNLNRYKEAEAELITAIRLDPTHTTAQADLINLVKSVKANIISNGFQRAHNEKDLEREEALYRQYLQIDPTDSSALNNLGRVLHKQGHFIEAEAAFREAIRYSANDHALREIATKNLNLIVEWGLNKDAFRQLLAMNEQSVAASHARTIEEIKDRSMRCFDDGRGCVYSNDHALEKVVLAPRGIGRSPSYSPELPPALKSDREFVELQKNKEKQEKGYKDTYDALQAAWAIKDSGKGDTAAIDILIVEQKNKLSIIKSEIRTTEIKIDQKYVDLGFTPPEQ